MVLLCNRIVFLRIQSQGKRDPGSFNFIARERFPIQARMRRGSHCEGWYVTLEKMDVFTLNYGDFIVSGSGA